MLSKIQEHCGILKGKSFGVRNTCFVSLKESSIFKMRTYNQPARRQNATARNLNKQVSELETGAGIILNDDIDFSPPWVVEVPSILLPSYL